MQKLSLLLAAATLIPISVLSWLGVRILQQDRGVERQRRREALEVGAGRLALQIERKLQDVEDQLGRGGGIALATVSEEEPPLSLFAGAEAAEFQRRDLNAAAGLYRALAKSPKPPVRAAALVRLGRVLRHLGDRAGAVQMYSILEQLGSATVGGQPAALVGWQGRCRVLEEARDVAELRTQAVKLAQALDSGRWAIDRATFDFYREMVQGWGAPPPSPDAIARVEAVIELRRAWNGGQLGPRGRRILREADAAVLAVWGGGPNNPAAWMAEVGEFVASLRPLWVDQQLAVSLYDTDGRRVFREARQGGVSLTPGETRLPFILSVASLAPEHGGGRLVLVSGLTLAFLAMVAAAYGLYRTTTREIALARRQSDFVSAVSHEFRTPLTSMRHLTELLVSRGITSEERKTQYYELLAHETERLHRMVESLLSFGRIEVGAYAWHLEPADATRFVRGIVEEFRCAPEARDRVVSCHIEEGLPAIQIDRESLSRALWNLLENAAKYSPANSPIRVAVRRQGGSVLLAVEDEGAGVPVGERERIFQKFVRGLDAKQSGVRGVGIGLALVKRIVEAHGGTVRLESEPGRGSIFTLVLPCHGF
ncbi:MAG TPA: ATP-binding protein [Bryobacteraceae bacterium]|nr:ATP-binding protein [Bryobacteraceae bacterium]